MSPTVAKVGGGRWGTLPPPEIRLTPLAMYVREQPLKDLEASWSKRKKKGKSRPRTWSILIFQNGFVGRLTIQIGPIYVYKFINDQQFEIRVSMYFYSLDLHLLIN